MDLNGAAVAIEEEFSRVDSYAARQLFDDYLLSDDSESFPSEVRESLIQLRDADQSFRTGESTAEEARVAGAEGIEALIFHDTDPDGECAAIRYQSS